MTNGISYEIIEEALKIINKTNVDLYKFLNLTRQQDKNNRDAGYYPIKYIRELAEFFNVSADVILDETLLEFFKNKPFVHINPNNIVYLDLFEMKAGAGSSGVFDPNFNIENRIGIDKTLLSKYDPRHTKAFKIIGDSMEPEYYEGDYAFVDMADGRDFLKINGIYVVRAGEDILVKRVDFMGGGKIKLISINPLYGDFYPHRDGIECEILGKVCGKLSLKEGLMFDNQGIG